MENQDRPHDSAESMNKALSSLYESRLLEINEQIAQCIEQCNWSANGVSKLFFMKVDEAYVKATTKILFIGRETFGWGVYDKLDKAIDLMANYENVSLSGKHYNSPFWWFRKGFSEKLGISKDEFMKATLWTNLSKIDVDKTTPTGQHFWHLSQMFINLLVAEIEIVKPNVVLIMTKNGHYSWHLNYYRWLRNESFKDYDESDELKRESVLGKKIERLIVPNRLPEHTYQICHPNVLRRKAGGYTTNADELINALASQINLQ